MSRLLKYITPKDSEWPERDDVKVNASIFRKITRTRKGNGRNFSPEHFDSLILRDAMPFFMDICRDVLPQKPDQIDHKNICMYKTSEADKLSKAVEKHLKKSSGPIGFMVNQAQFTIEAIRHVLKLQDDKELETFMILYRQRDIKDTADLINFLQEFIDNHQEATE